MDSSKKPLLINTREIANRWGYSPWIVLKVLKHHKLKAIRPVDDMHYAFRRSEVEVLERTLHIVIK